GIAGLTAAAALTRAGWQVTVLERATGFGEVGAGLAITRNGMAALGAIDAASAVRAVGRPAYAGGIRDRADRWLLRLPEPAGDDSINRFWGVHRQRLHSALMQSAGDAELINASRVVAVQPGDPLGERATVTWRDCSGGTHQRESDLLVAADGARSTVRARLFPHRLRYSGWSCWRAVTSTGVDDRGFVQFWGPHAEFGILPIGDAQQYWYGYFRHPAKSPFDDELAAAAERFACWAPAVRAAVAATERPHLIRHDVHHLPGGIPTYVIGRTVVIGDAAHAMLPTMGQGANTSLEDGVCVGRIIGRPVADGGDIAQALIDYDRARRPRCRSIAHQSLLTARLGAHLPGGWPQHLRNAVLRATPPGLAATGARALRWRPPG
ncbi:MAG: FAD-dependent monooxygenase, partial [Pseudonocardia sp.]|nr:FAD-dependent monooxygenase [Pseudonocardia sp.]